MSSITDHTGTRIIRKQFPGILRAIECPQSESLMNQSIIVPSQHCDKVRGLLNKHSVLLTSGYKVPAIKTACLNIRLIDSHVVNRAPARLSLSEKVAVREILRELLDNKIIRESESPYASPIVLVRKKEGSYRMCVDYRELNSHTVKDRLPLPLIQDQLDRLGRGKYFTSLDMASGFYQIPIAPESVEKTAFITPEGLFEFLRMPFGLANAPAVFSRAVNKALGDLIHNVALVFFDDLLIPSTTPEEAISDLGLVLEALGEAGFSLNINKCTFL